MEMNNRARHHCTLSQPAARHSGSPTTGTHDSSDTGLPQRRMRESARSSWPLRGTRNGRRQAKRRPRTQEVMPPRVYPALATMSSSHLVMGRLLTYHLITTSVPPGSKVEEMKALKNNAHHPVWPDRISVIGKYTYGWWCFCLVVVFSLLSLFFVLVV